MTGHRYLRVNVGCGSSPTPGWLNFDNSMTVRLARWRWPGAVLKAAGILGDAQINFARVARESGIRWADATRRIPLESSSVEVLFSSHMLEHLDKEGARGFLLEARRVLRIGGILRIAVPDLRQLAERYFASGDADRFVEDSLLAVSARRGVVERIRYSLVGERHHLWMYDGDSLMRKLAACGFAEPSRKPPGTTSIPDPGPLNLYERANESVYVEAVRGS